jgi:hypothetical protein
VSARAPLSLTQEIAQELAALGGAGARDDERLCAETVDPALPLGDAKRQSPTRRRFAAPDPELANTRSDGVAGAVCWRTQDEQAQPPKRKWLPASVASQMCCK